jgi:hypothetical protein
VQTELSLVRAELRDQGASVISSHRSRLKGSLGENRGASVRGSHLPGTEPWARQPLRERTIREIRRRPPAPPVPLVLRPALPPRRQLETNMALTNVKWLICLLIISEPTLAQAKCVRTVSELKANHVKARWHETTENDGKPLTISITDGPTVLSTQPKRPVCSGLPGRYPCVVPGALQRLP